MNPNFRDTRILQFVGYAGQPQVLSQTMIFDSSFRTASRNAGGLNSSCNMIFTIFFPVPRSQQRPAGTNDSLRIRYENNQRLTAAMLSQIQREFCHLHHGTEFGQDAQHVQVVLSER